MKLRGMYREFPYTPCPPTAPHCQRPVWTRYHQPGATAHLRAALVCASCGSDKQEVTRSPHGVLAVEVPVCRLHPSPARSSRSPGGRRAAPAFTRQGPAFPRVSRSRSRSSYPVLPAFPRVFDPLSCFIITVL